MKLNLNFAKILNMVLLFSLSFAISVLGSIVLYIKTQYNFSALF
jgi:hypothetical protein